MCLIWLYITLGGIYEEGDYPMIELSNGDFKNNITKIMILTFYHGVQT